TMTPPIISKDKKNKKNDEEANYDELKHEFNDLKRQINKLERRSYSLNFYYAIALQAEDTPKSIIDYTDLILMNMQCRNVPKELRFDCHPEDGSSELECTKRGCCWVAINNNHEKNTKNITNKNPLNIPYCFYPSDWKLYNYENTTEQYDGNANDFVGYLRKNNLESFYKNDLQLIKMESTSINESILRVKIYDPTNTRYTPTYPLRDDVKPFSNNITNTKYQFEIDKSKPGFRIKRRFGSKAVIFDSIEAGGFVFADQFLQMSTLLPSSNIYGLGEHRTNLKLNTNWQIFTLFNKDQAPVENANLYGSHPFYLIIEENGDSHGVLFLNSNAMDIILQPTPALTYRSIGGIFDFYFFMGPTPADVLRQYTLITSKPFLPPYWSLGFHLCRFGYRSLNKTIEVWNRTRAAGIPFDTQWNDLDYMNNANDFTYDNITFKDLPKFVDQLHQLGMHYIPLIDPGISASEPNGSYLPYDEGIKTNIFVQDNSTGQPFVGKVWNRVSTVWPDFTHKNISDYWHKMMLKMYNYFKYDGAWIDMNEPSNFYDGRINGCTQNPLDYPPYTPNVIGNLLSTKTLCMNAKHESGWHYDIHNTYAIGEAVETTWSLKKMRNKRAFAVSRGTWIGLGGYAAHWTGDVYSTWHDLKMSIPEILSFSLYQIPMVGADICGFNSNTTKALCNRWMQLGAFYPFSRNHNSDDTIEQDPVAMGDLVVKSSIKALTIRYRFLPYLYSLFFRASVFGDTVARPLFVEFVEDRNTWNIDTQFLWGSAFMIVPVLDDDKIEVVGYFPRGYWYNYYTKERIISEGQNFTLDAPLDTIPIVIRGGFILPAQVPGKTTTESRNNNFELLIALDENECANGELYLDDGEGLFTYKMNEYDWFKFQVEKQTLFMSRRESSNGKMKFKIGKIEIMGVTKDVKWVTINDGNVSFKYDKKQFYLVVDRIPQLQYEIFKLKWG
ncbi:hypothetical protein PV325_009722, partial [Microctonus aethiopoides]